MKKKLVILVFMFIIVVVASFAYGWLAHRYLIFPYPQIKYLYSALKDGENADRLHEKVKSPNLKISAETELDVGIDLSGLISERRVIETLTVPLMATTFDVGSIRKFGAPSKRGPKGGLCTIENLLVVFDGAGNGILIDLNSMIIEAYLLPKAFINEEGYELHRINDVTCQSAQSGKRAYISYETMDVKSSEPVLKFRTVVGKIELKDFQNSKVHTIWSSQLTGDNEAGRLALLDNNHFLITFSDYSTPEQQSNAPHLAQEDSALAGKIILVNMSTKRHELYSRGHRNPQGLFVTSKGNILATEHGPRGGDELNEIIRGGNYGWPKETHGVDYGSYRWKHGEIGRHDNYNQPIFSWVPSIAISNLLKVSNFHSSWFEDILITSLKSGSLFRTRRDNAVGVEFVEQIWLGPRIRDIEETEDERIVLWTDNSSLIFLSPATEFISADKRTESATWKDVSLKLCLNCHHFGLTNQTHTAPSLTRIFSRDIASDNFNYSEVLSSIKGKWTAETLKKYIKDPQSFAKGSTMNYRIEDEDLASKIVDQLLLLDNIGE